MLLSARLFFPVKQEIKISGMEKRVYFHYNHTDSCKSRRWNTRECYQFMYERPWQRVVDFYSNLVGGGLPLSSLFGVEAHPTQHINGITKAAEETELVNASGKDRTGRWARTTYKIVLSYHGGSFDGWQKQPELNTVQGVLALLRSICGMPKTMLTPSLSLIKLSDAWIGYFCKHWSCGNMNQINVIKDGLIYTKGIPAPWVNTRCGGLSVVEKALGRFVDERKAQQLKDRSLPVEGCATVAGRTDKGVTALQQVCSFYTWRKDVNVGDIKDAINTAAEGKLRVISISEVSRVFHPNFSAKWRHYFYIFPISDEEEEQSNEMKKDESPCYYFENDGYKKGLDGEDDGSLEVEDEEEFDCGKKPSSFSISKVNQILQQLEGKPLSYRMFARDTKASRSVGPPTECFIYHAKAREARLPCLEEVHGKGQRVMCVELVANRFLRKMVRVLVATSIREAAAGAGEDALLRLMDATCRRATAPPAPPDGLCLVDVGYEDFRSENSLMT